MEDVNSDSGIIYISSPNITTTHAFTTRFGGVSSGIYESLNLAQRADDDIEYVKENYSRLCRALSITPDNIVCSTQVHGTHVRVVTFDDCGRLFKPDPHTGDALITNTSGVALMVFVADCVPILLYDSVKRVAGAVHAGWRGTVANIAGVTVSKMMSEFSCSPSDINAAIGPCIAKCCFETDSDVADALKKAMNEDSRHCFSKHGNKYYVDLKEANRILLKNAGVENITVSDECTSCRSDKYWSHRKTQGKRGSQAAIIVIVE